MWCAWGGCLSPPSQYHTTFTLRFIQRSLRVALSRLCDRVALSRCTCALLCCLVRSALACTVRSDEMVNAHLAAAMDAADHMLRMKVLSLTTLFAWGTCKNCQTLVHTALRVSTSISVMPDCFTMDNYGYLYLTMAAHGFFESTWPFTCLIS